jgi:hypothetical protein
MTRAEAEVANRTVSTTKKLASKRQIEAAIQHYKKGEFECAITLAHAGENILNKPGSRIISLYERLKEAIVDKDHNELPVWLKHSSGSDTKSISELEVVVLIQRAISKFVATFDGATSAMKAFSESERKKFETENAQ